MQILPQDTVFGGTLWFHLLHFLNQNFTQYYAAETNPSGHKTFYEQNILYSAP
jgi:hypothetical protein